MAVVFCVGLASSAGALRSRRVVVASYCLAGLLPAAAGGLLPAADLCCSTAVLLLLSDGRWFGKIGDFADRNISAIPPPRGTVWPWQRVRPSPALGTQPTSAPAAA
eukprot:COSAG01_NODE_8148_length_2903_cov_2.324893_1_plen_105_part_10